MKPFTTIPPTLETAMEHIKDLLPYFPKQCGAGCAFSFFHLPQGFTGGWKPYLHQAVEDKAAERFRDRRMREPP